MTIKDENYWRELYNKELLIERKPTHPMYWIHESSKAGRLKIRLNDFDNQADIFCPDTRKVVATPPCIDYDSRTGEETDSGLTIREMLRIVTGISDEEIERAIDRGNNPRIII